ncbi:hypothetical protein [Myxococcus qinghaiensis]|nr:hypothetical protein [Myxococcus qinghaiensis]MCP3166207.1 hypothetical protein [Myxococcus qinghaiensis]
MLKIIRNDVKPGASLSVQAGIIFQEVVQLYSYDGIKGREVYPTLND